MIQISQLKLPISHTEADLRQKIKKTLRCGETLFSYEIIRQSLDARHKEDKKFVYTVHVKAENEKKILKKVHSNNVMSTNERHYSFPKPGDQPLETRPVIVGSGPAGLFCAWYLARAGYRPLVLERGEEADKRMETVNRFWKTGVLDPESNVQFGEGGAGTFSDGKLNTLVKDSSGRNREVLKRFTEAGADPEILYQQKPHLGTDVLVNIVQTMRRQIEEMGGDLPVAFQSNGSLYRKRKAEGSGDQPYRAGSGSGMCPGCRAQRKGYLFYAEGQGTCHGAQSLCSGTSHRTSSVHDQSGSLWRTGK